MITPIPEYQKIQELDYGQLGPNATALNITIDKLNEVINKINSFNVINKPVETTNEQPSKQYRELLRWMKADKDVQNYPTGNKFFNSTNGGFTIMLKPDGTYEVDYEFK